MDTQTDPTRERMMLEQIERDPDLTQASLANQLGVAVGTVNSLIKATSKSSEHSGKNCATSLPLRGLPTEQI